MGIVFRIEKVEGGLAYGTVRWAEKGLSSGAVSGPYGRGELPRGLYQAARSKLIEKSEEGYCDSLQQCWFQVIDPQFSTDRFDLGIHPDGNVAGTLGCIGLIESDTGPWLEAFKSVGSEGTSVEVL